jgi:hypothetical protein
MKRLERGDALIMRLILILAFLAYAGAVNAASYTVSNKAINTIICPDKLNVSDVFISEKTPIKTEIRKDKLFFEFLEMKVDGGNGIIYSMYEENPTTISVFCGDDEYPMTLNPANVKAARVELPTRKTVAVELDGLPREEQLAKLIESILTDDVKLKGANASGAAKIGKAEVYLRKVYTSGNYKAKELYIYSPDGREIKEAELLSLKLIKDPAAVSMPQRVKGWQRVIAVEEVVK